MNPDRHATIAYVMNKMGPGVEGSPRTDRYFRLIYDASETDASETDYAADVSRLISPWTD